jgi:uncharacterized protein
MRQFSWCGWDAMSEANIATLQSLYAAYGRGDIQSILNGCTTDVTWESGGGGADFPVFGVRTGIAGVADFARTVAEIVDFSEFSPREFYVDKDKVFVLGHYAMTVKKTGRKAAADWIHVFTFRGGKVAKFREFTDTALFVAAYRA